MNFISIPKVIQRFTLYAMLALIVSPASAQAQPKGDASEPKGEPPAENPLAPELEPNLGWLNTDHPLRFSDELKGRIVILDFWTYCCINCMHILPDLAYIEEKYKDQPVQVIGVHSAKFENEAARTGILAAVQRYDVRHPVVIDKNMSIWRKYGAQSWPTFMLIDSEGRVVGMASGEGLRDDLDKAVEQLLKLGRDKKTLASGSLVLKRESSGTEGMPLAFPGKVVADPAGKRLFVSDSNHNRIVVATLPDAEGKSKLIAAVGSGKRGTDDGPAEKASFYKPQGITLAGDTLYVADTENHLIRAIDLKSNIVKTIAGTGKQGADRKGGAKGTKQAVSSPWDVCAVGDTLYIAMAGTHQIWTMDLKSGVVEAYAGSGRENIADGSLAEAALAQTSGLTFMKGVLYSADSETSSIRRIDPKEKTVTTIIGHGLFEFGDVDGEAGKARFQHCLGIANDGESLYLADTYNHKIKKIDPEAKKAVTLFGTGKPAKKTDDGKPGFFEPGGLSVAEGKLYVADTNNHRVVMIDLKSGAWAEIKIEGLKPAAE